MPSLWDDIAKTIRDGVDTVVEKTEELTKIGKIRVDILNIKRNIERNFSELGGRVYHIVAKEKKSAIDSDKQVKEIIECIKILEKELDDKKAELDHVKNKEKASTQAKPAGKPKSTQSTKKASSTKKKTTSATTKGKTQQK